MTHKISFGLLALLLIGFAITGCQAQPCPAPDSGASEQTSAPENEPLNTSGGALGLSDMHSLSLYENAAQGFKISYPDNWTPKEAESNEMSLVVGFLAPGEDIDNPLDYLTVQIENLPAAQKVTLEQYTQAINKNLKSSYPDFSVIGEDDLVISNLPGHVMVYTATVEQTPYQILLAYTIKDNKAYVLTYYALTNRYSEFEDAAKNMINSLEFI